MFQRPMLGRRGAIPALVSLAAALIGGCGAPSDSVPPSAAAPTVEPVARASATAGDRLYLRDGLKGGAERLTIVDSISGVRERDLPPGVVSPDWTTLYAAEQSGDATSVRALDLASGRVLRETTLAGAYALPMITSKSAMGGLSPDGRWLALMAVPAQPNSKQSGFAVLDTTFKHPPTVITLSGSFTFDGLNNSGSSLFLTQSLADDAAAPYLVRRYDLINGRLDPKVIVEKGEEEEPMSGVRQTAVASRHGDWLYSLYLDPSHGPFIHALPIDDPQFAFCIDLPTVAKQDLARQSRWALVMSAEQGTLYTINGALGLVSEYSLGDGVPQLVRTKTLFEAPAGVAGLARPKLLDSAAAALAPNGKTLFALGDQGLLAIDTATLALRGRYLADWALDGVALSPDGMRLYAASAAAGKIVRLDPAMGTIVAEVPVAGQPSGVVRAATRVN